MKLRSEIEIKPFEREIDYSSRLFMIGSCFAASIGERMLRAKFGVAVNPTGTLFNPLSICATLDRLHRGEGISAEQMQEGDLGWYHYDFHSSLNGESREVAVVRINEAITESGERLRAADCVVITLGTAWVYERDGELVANCHKEPARNFTRRRVSVDEIAERLIETIDGALCDKRVLFTISPIRHLKDGLVENSLSKATLRMAVERVVEARGERVDYFPSFEIMMDDLRDYRFYADDLTHPSQMAVEYIWERFTQAAISPAAREVMQRVERVVRAAEHRPINPRSEAHRRHCEAQLKAIEQIEGVDFEKESRYFSEQLKINL